MYCKAARATTVDHIIPRARGGDNNPANLVAACKPCNGKKGDAMPSGEMLQRIPKELQSYYLRRSNRKRGGRGRRGKPAV